MREKEEAGAINTGLTIRQTTTEPNLHFTTEVDAFLAAYFPTEQEAIHLRTVDAKGIADGKKERTWQRPVSRFELLNNAALQSEIESINQSRGICFVVNAGGNKDKDISRFNACFVENDSRSIEEQHQRLDAAQLPPSIRVETRKSVHAYWLISGDCTAKEWREVQRLLVKAFDGDKAIVNPSRIMRLPGYNHVLYNQETASYEYKPVVQTHSEYRRRYSIAELQNAFSNQPTKPSIDQKTTESINSAFVSEKEIATPENQALAEKCLPHLSRARCDEYQEWLSVGIALYNIFTGTEKGLTLWREWSKQSKKYTEGACESKWVTFSDQTDGEKISVGSIVAWAKEDSPAFSDSWAEQTAATYIQNRRDDYVIRDSGVYFTGQGKDGENQNIRICSRLEITAASRDNQSESWGRLLEFDDMDGRRKRWSMPMSLLSGEGNEYRARLLSMGLEIEPNRKARELLTTYIQGHSTPARVTCVPKVGWYGKTFVFPDTAFGEPENERVLFQTEIAPEHRLSVSGTLSQWQDNIAKYCVGNSRLAFAVSAGFAGCLAPLLHLQGGGFHFRGASSVGKTTTLFVAGSVWGGGTKNGYIQTWRTTANGLESIAEIHNHGLLCLDEISECNPKDVGETAYMLANGQGKARMTKSVMARKRLEWTLIFLSSGEQSLDDMVSGTGGRIRGGQEVRMVDLEADAGKGLGLFENTHGFTSYQLAEHLSRAALCYYGTPIRAFLEKLVARKDISSVWNAYRKQFVETALGGQKVAGEVERVCNKFALVGMAGMLATILGVTGWHTDEATQAAHQMFQVWIAGRGSVGVSDTENGVRQVISFIEAHGSSRFQNLIYGANGLVMADESRVNNRVGFKRSNDETKETEYLILPEAFKNEVCKGYSLSLVSKELAKRNMLRTQAGQGHTVSVKLPDFGKCRVYSVRMPSEVDT